VREERREEGERLLRGDPSSGNSEEDWSGDGAEESRMLWR
jgi:hypothetical protein